MKVLAFNSSPRPAGNTAQLIRMVFAPLEAAGIETELVSIGGRPLHGCTACLACKRNQDLRCIIDDELNDYIGRMLAADAIILGSPTYVADVTSEMKALIDRATYVLRNNGNPLSRKVGAAVSAVRRAGSIHALDTMHHFFQVMGMVTPGSSYWNLGIGREQGEVADDAEGVRTMADLGENIAWLLGKLHG